MFQRWLVTSNARWHPEWNCCKICQDVSYDWLNRQGHWIHLTYSRHRFWYYQLLHVSNCTRRTYIAHLFSKQSPSFEIYPKRFFLLLLYNSLCTVLAFSNISFHLLLSLTRVFQLGTFSFCISFLTSSSQRVFGLPIGLFEMGFQECIALTIPVSCIHK